MDSSDQLSAYLDGELTPQEIHQLERRLEQEPALRSELDALRQTVGLLQRHGRLAAPERLQAGVSAGLVGVPIPVRGGFWRNRAASLQGLAVAAVALVVVGVALSGVVQGSRRPAVSTVSKADTSEQLADYGLAAERHPARARAVTESPVAVAADGERLPMSKAAELENSPEPKAQMSAGAADVELSASDVITGHGGEPSLYGGGSTHTIAIRQADLSTVARLIQRHRGRDLRGVDPAERIADLGDGEHGLDLRLPDAAARNAFVRDLRAAFPGRYGERVASDGGVSLSGAQVGLKIIVSHLAPPTTMQDHSVGVEGAESP